MKKFLVHHDVCVIFDGSNANIFHTINTISLYTTPQTSTKQIYSFVNNIIINVTTQKMLFLQICLSK